MGLSNKPELEEEVHIPDPSMILEAEEIPKDEDSASDKDRPIYVLCPLLSTHVKKVEDWCRNNIFQTWIHCNGQVCSMVIDGGNCTNAVSNDAVNKLSMKNEPHPSSYKVS